MTSSGKEEWRDQCRLYTARTLLARAGGAATGLWKLRTSSGRRFDARTTNEGLPATWTDAQGTYMLHSTATCELPSTCEQGRHDKPARGGEAGTAVRGELEFQRVR